MKICLFGVSGIALGKHNIKDPRLDQADKLVEAQKKTCAQADVVEEKELLTSDAVLTTRAALSDLLIKDLDAVETRLNRDPGEAEKAVLQKLADALMSEKSVSAVGLTADELKAISAHNFYSNKPVVVAEEAELAAPDALLVRAFKESGYLSFLTVGGKENRAWPIRAGQCARPASTGASGAIIWRARWGLRS
jgi:ribosome-binding ATPase YchF (GTP1/OBG family)